MDLENLSGHDFDAKTVRALQNDVALQFEIGLLAIGLDDVVATDGRQ